MSESQSNAKIVDDTIYTEIWYPARKDGDEGLGTVRHVEVDLVDVRASDGLRITYDFDRDGWVIQQPTKLCWSADDKSPDMCWKEVAFVQSWQLRAEQDENERRVTGGVA